MQEVSSVRAAGKVEAVGLDFGTTNSAIAIVGADGSPRLARFSAAEGGDPTEMFRSILFFEAPEETGGTDSAVSVGNDAIRRYLAAAGNGRLVQSLKSFLADKTFESTDIMGETYTLGDLIAPIITALRDAAIAQFGELPPRIVVGRPVHFAAAGNPDEALARSRLDIAIRRAGWTDVVFEYEPVAAAYDYALRITRDETVLIADFGGGTSDFSVLRRNRERLRSMARRATRFSATTASASREMHSTARDAPPGRACARARDEIPIAVRDGAAGANLAVHEAGAMASSVVPEGACDDAAIRRTDA